MAKIGLDYGHGNNTFPPDKGVSKNGKNYPEYDFNAKLGRKVKSLLKSHGHTIVEGQPLNGRDVPLITRTNLYNRENVDLVWSIHANAGTPGVNGRCSFYWHTSSKSKDLAFKYAEEVKKAGYSTHGNGTHASKRGSWTNLHICRETTAPAVLTENGFMTGSKDFDLVFGAKQDQYIDDMAQVHVKAIQRWLGESFNGKEKPSKPAPSNPKPSKPQTSTSASGRVESKVNGLRFYNKPSWSDKDVVGRVDKGIGFPTIVKKVKVGKGNQYQVKNSKGSTFYITAADKYVKVVGGSAPKASKPAPKKSTSNSGKAGKLKIVGVSNAAIVMSKPDRNNSSNLGTVNKGSTLPLNGSVRGKNSSSGYWEVKYKGKLGYITGKYGKQV